MAEYKYTMKELSKIIDRTPARIYSYFKEDTEFYFSSNNRRKDNKKGYLYNEAVLERLKNKLLMENDVPPQDMFPTKTENPQNNPQSNEIEQKTRELEELKKEVEELRRENIELKEKYEKAEKERLELINQNGMALLSISQMTQKLLPAPSLGQRIKNIFKKKKD